MFVLLHSRGWIDVITATFSAKINGFFVQVTKGMVKNQAEGMFKLERENIEEKLENVDASIIVEEGAILKVDAKIDAVEIEINQEKQREPQDKETLEHLRTEKVQLRKEKEQLRKEKEILLQAFVASNSSSGMLIQLLLNHTGKLRVEI